MRLFAGVALSALGNGLTLPFLFVYLARVCDLPTSTVGLVLAGMGLSAWSRRRRAAR